MNQPWDEIEWVPTALIFGFLFALGVSVFASIAKALWDWFAEGIDRE